MRSYRAGDARRFLAVTAVVFAAGCGSAGSVEKQAEEVGSIAAEGALLAHDASDGGTTDTFTRVHARELAKKANGLAPKIRNTDLERVAISVGSDLKMLAEHAGEEQVAAGVERSLDDLAKQAEEIGKAAS